MKSEYNGILIKNLSINDDGTKKYVPLNERKKEVIIDIFDIYTSG
jgi:hypothetical protein